MWECPRCHNVNINNEQNCINCGMSRAERYLEAPMETLIDIAQRRADYTVETLQEVYDALAARDAAEVAEELKQYIVQRKNEETKKTNPTQLHKKLLIGSGACGGGGILLKIITGSVQQSDEYLVAQTAVRMGRMFSSSGSEFDQAKGFMQSIDFFSGLGGFLIFAAVVFLVIYLLVRVNPKPLKNVVLPQSQPTGAGNTAPPVTDTAMPAGECNFCTQCGGRIQAEDSYCAKCGRRL